MKLLHLPRWWRLMILGAIVAAAPASASQTPAATPEAGDATPIQRADVFGPVRGQRDFRIAFLVPYPDNAYWESVQEEVLARAEEDDVAIDVFPLSDSSVPEQLAQLSDAVAQGYDGIILGAIDPVGIVPGIEAAHRAGVPIVALDVEPAAGEIVCLVAIDDVQAATAAGLFIAEAIGGVGRVINLQGSMTTETARARDKGLRSAFEDFPDINVDDAPAEWDRDFAEFAVGEILKVSTSSTPTAIDARPSAIFAANDPMALGAVDAITAAEAQGIVVVGIGGSPEALQAIVDGELTATVARVPVNAGSIAVDIMVRHLNGDDVPRHVDPGVILVTDENVELMINETDQSSE